MATGWTGLRQVLGGPDGGRRTRPEADTVYTNDTVDLIMQATGDVVGFSFELVVDGTEVVDTFTGLNNVNYTWSTLDRDEGSYELGLRFDVDGVEQLDSDIRTVIVDRSPPTIVSSTPEQDAEHVPAATPITITFSEPLLADSVTTEAVKLSLGGQEIDYTVTLSEDGLTVTLTFASHLAALPYDATLSFDGVTDLAGNEPTDELNWHVPAWLKEEFANSSTDLSRFKVLEVGDEEYLIARKFIDSGDTYVKIFKSEAGEWTEVGSTESVVNIMTVDATVLNGKIFIAYMYTSIITVNQFVNVRLIEFDPCDTTITDRNFRGWAGSPPQETAISLAMNNDVGLVAIAVDGEIRAYEFTDNSLSSATNTVDTATYPRVRAPNMAQRGPPNRLPL